MTLFTPVYHLFFSSLTIFYVPETHPFKAEHRKKYMGLYYLEGSKFPPEIDADFLKRNSSKKRTDCNIEARLINTNEKTIISFPKVYPLLLRHVMF
ncbi:MAG: hypothetical protein HY754_12685 [Nitrospirae bacterium]|nr:hypothetical protein [Nitrospirota bacterium]